jgi:hypothetical protein
MSTEPNTLTRRAALQTACGGFGMMSLASLLGQQSFASATKTGATPGPHFAPKAKRVIFLFMNGAPSHVDTFDPKPALRKHQDKEPTEKLLRGKKGKFLPSPYSFSKHGQSGIEVSESLPHIANVIDECCVLRSMHTDVPNHEPGLLKMHTGNLQPIRPSIGSWALYGLGHENQNLPGYVVLRPSPKIVVGPALWSNSFLPAKYQAASVITRDMAVEKLLTDIRNPHLSLAQQRRQLDLLQKLNHLHLSQRDGDTELEAQIKAMETAYQMQTEATETFDISKEPAHIREMYGTSRFGNSCLLARRLVENGVRFVSVYYTADRSNQPWDTHSSHHQRHPELCADSDRATGALIRDLKARGLLDDTLVIWGGEFGRTPFAQANKKSPGKVGRDHHATGFSMFLAGGGVKGGMVYGATDELGMKATENRMHVHDLHATILHLLGLDHERLTYRWSGRDFRLTDVHGNVAHNVIA